MNRNETRKVSDAGKDDRVKQKVRDFEETKRARNELAWLKSQFPNKSKLQILPVVLRKLGRRAAELLIKEIEEHQANKLSFDDLAWLDHFKQEHLTSTDPKNSHK